jgi:nucleoside-diphosphate-sugar epimerase
MHIFVTGATGYIGFAIVKDLIAAGHQVTGMTRSEASGQKLVAAGARIHTGSIEDLDNLRRAAASADGVIHTAFYHKLSHMPLGTKMSVFFGGLPGGIVRRFLAAAVETDRSALKVMGDALAGSGRPLLAPFATMALQEGQLATEDQSYDPTFFAAQRAITENLLQELAARGVRTSTIRLPPSVHGAGDQGLVPMLIKTARKKRQSAYVGAGTNRWPSVHRDDAASLFRLALEHGTAGAVYHGVAEQGIAFRQIAELIGGRLQVPVASLNAEQAEKQFSFLAPFVARDNPVSSAATQQRLGWRPMHARLLADLDNAGYFED